ncbi:MAG: N-acetylmuramoyl-L-alanine amidase [Muribaculaceae bacterium]|nr:N-acetylmuramoyl-L-alanine amidase [Muribaculaceae bacterium]
MKTKTAKILAAAVMMAGATTLTARDAQGIKVYLNPGHGGHESNDRNVVIEPYKPGDPNGYWESNSNLSKGLQLRDMLEAKGYAVEMSRVNNTEDDDLDLGVIVALSNKSEADIFFSIHSNATGVVARRNFPLMLFRGWDNDPELPTSLTICKILNKYLLQNGATYWTATNENCRGDWSFYPQWNGAGLGALRGQKMTAMLSEGSFHDYIPEAYRLMSDDFCWLEAWHFRKAIDEFFEVDGLPVGAVAGRLNDTRVPRGGDYIMFGDDKFATIQDALVELLDQDGNVLQTYTTDPININGFYLFKDVEPGNYKIRASVETHMPVEQDITVTADEITFANLQMSKVRNTPPVVESYTPEWKDGDEAVLCNTKITIQFNWDMDIEATEKAFSINPPIEGTFTWEDLNYRLVFTPATAYDINTVYTVTLSTEAMHPAGIHLEEPFSFSFLTTSRNFMEILGSFPKHDEEVHYQGAAIEFRFDKLPNVTPILNQITCKDSKGNTVAFNKRGLTNSKNGAEYGFFRIPISGNLTVGETYTLELSGEFADKDGITIKEPVDIEFKAVDASVTSADFKTVYSMDDHSLFSVNEDASINVATASVAKSSDKLEGNAAVTFNYAFNDTESGEILYSYTGEQGETHVFPADGTIALQIYSDLSNNEVSMELTNANSVQYVPVCNMDFLGWRYFEIPVSLEGNADLTGFKLVQNSSLMSRTGSFSVDNVMSGSTTGVDDIEIADFTLTVGDNYIVAGAGCYIQGIELIGLNGTVLAKNSGNVLNITDTPAGNYIVNVYAAGGHKAVKIQITH